MATTSPTEDDLKKALIELRAEHATLGISKLHLLLLGGHPDWLVSEKRTRKFLQEQGLVLRANSSNTPTPSASFPTSRLIDNLELSKWTTKVEIKYFGKKKGKGLIAKEHIAEGDIIWKEDPFILAPEWEIYDLQAASSACAYCSTPLSGPRTIECPERSQASSVSCNARFCNRLCLSRSMKTHPLLCPVRNPASVPLLTFARRSEWMALHALTQCTARVLLANEREEDFKSDWNIVHAFAQLGMEERAKGGWLGGVEPDRETWKKAYQLYIHAFRDPVTSLEKKKLSRVLKKPLPQEVSDDIFDYDAFLKGLGRMSLNLEAHGGLITVIAKKDIEPGEELCITYVNPALPLDSRRKQLLEWGFGLCQCTRCIEEEKNPNRADAASVEAGDLERELKAGLGVI
ncbi:hypothetical protein ABKN59_004451 [Abortiporus biennis]